VARELVMFLIMNAIGLGIAAACVWFTKYVLDMTDPTSVFIAGSVVGLVLGTIFRFFAYRFWVFGAEMDQEAEFAHDHELLTLSENGADTQSVTPDTDTIPTVKG
jgi:putative flippase GtrA